MPVSGNVNEYFARMEREVARMQERMDNSGAVDVPEDYGTTINIPLPREPVSMTWTRATFEPWVVDEATELSAEEREAERLVAEAKKKAEEVRMRRIQQERMLHVENFIRTGQPIRLQVRETDNGRLYVFFEYDSSPAFTITDKAVVCLEKHAYLKPLLEELAEREGLKCLQYKKVSPMRNAVDVLYWCWKDDVEVDDSQLVESSYAIVGEQPEAEAPDYDDDDDYDYDD